MVLDIGFFRIWTRCPNVYSTCLHSLTHYICWTYIFLFICIDSKEVPSFCWNWSKVFGPIVLWGGMASSFVLQHSHFLVFFNRMVLFFSWNISLLVFLQGRNVDTLILYFGEDPARCPFEQGEDLVAMISLCCYKSIATK